MRIGDIWSSIRGVIREAFSFADIKDLVGAAGLPVHRLAHLQQAYSGATTKGQLMDAIDGLVQELDPAARDRFVAACIEETLRENPYVSEKLELLLSRVGWGLGTSGPYPIEIQIDLETASLGSQVGEAIEKCLRRYRNGDIDGAITAICGAVDSLTAGIYSRLRLGDEMADSYQQRVSKSFNALEPQFRRPFLVAGLQPDEQNRVWQNHRGAVNQAAYVLGAFRREYSDSHGAKQSPPELVQRAIDCAVFVLRSILALDKVMP